MSRRHFQWRKAREADGSKQLSSFSPDRSARAKALASTRRPREDYRVREGACNQRKPVMGRRIGESTWAWYPSCGEAATAIGGDSANVSRVARGEVKHSKGFEFRLPTAEETTANELPERPDYQQCALPGCDKNCQGKTGEWYPSRSTDALRYCRSHAHSLQRGTLSPDGLKSGRRSSPSPALRHANARPRRRKLPSSDSDSDDDAAEETSFSPHDLHASEDDPIEDSPHDAARPVPFPRIPPHFAHVQRFSRGPSRQHAAADGGCVYAPHCRPQRAVLVMQCGAPGCLAGAHRACFIQCWDCDERNVVYCRLHASDAGCLPRR